MRKRIVDPSRAHVSQRSEHRWLDLHEVAMVEVSSEDPQFPIDSALGSNREAGWRASQSGEQLIRIVFDQPTSVRRIQLHFFEPELERTQEFSLRWSSADGGTTCPSGKRA
jgi:uncharacterized protein (DUF736 family)